MKKYGQAALLLSECALDAQPLFQMEKEDDCKKYVQFKSDADNPETGRIELSEEMKKTLEKTYAQSWIKEWLNHDFLMEAFTEKERTFLIDAKDCAYGRKMDIGKVFLLSVDDINDKEMFPSDLDTGCCATPWAKSRYSDHIEIERQKNATIPYDERASWWIRGEQAPMAVHGGGKEYVGVVCCVLSVFEPLAVRPAILIDVDRWNKGHDGKFFSGFLGKIKKKAKERGGKRSDAVYWEITEEDRVVGHVVQAEEATSNKGAVLVYISLCEGMQPPIVIQTQPGIQKERIKALAVCFGMSCSGVSEMQMTMGSLYWHGSYVPKSYEESVRWSRYAANQGDPNAMLDLAECYNKGIGGLEKDDEKAFQLVKEAADKKFPLAIRNLAECYLNGIGVEQDIEKGTLLMQEFKKLENQ